ncbi:MAG: bacterioferritin [Candidatus Brocadiae bacterium]|nr:bacterioferritin [Candidatus Brocadiia bacterium]
MKGNPKILETLNALLADELGAISQYMVHSEMAANWGYKNLHERIEKRAIDEMKHAEKLIGRILALEGRPIVSKLSEIKVGEDVPKQISHDIAAEIGAIKAYNDAIKLTADLGDNATKEMLVKILMDEDDHMADLEEMRDQIEQLSLQIFLSTQLK